MTSHDVVVIGAGPAGLAAGWSLGERACVLEREQKPGGLVRTDCIDGYWFDHVLHLLHLSDPPTEARLRTLLGPILTPCPPNAWVDCSAGSARYPLQNNLRTLDTEAIVRILSDFAEEAFRDEKVEPSTHEEVLLRSFGKALCEIFFFPYQKKVWKRPLSNLAATEFQWNISRPNFDEILRGAFATPSSLAPQSKTIYNQNSWYPRPPGDAPIRGMEVLIHEMLAHVSELKLSHDVVSIDPQSRQLRVRTHGKELGISYESGCVATLPLPNTIRLCTDAPPDLLRNINRLHYNRVRSVMVGVRGPRHENTGLWRYYADESLIFSRLAFMTEFDPLMAPSDGFGILAEVTEPAEDPKTPDAKIAEKVIADIRRVGWIRPLDEILVTRVLTISPAYVVFSHDTRNILAEAKSFLTERQIEPLGRYGRWEYSSIESVIRDGFECSQTFRSSAKRSGP
ncbi:MAG: FAD-dependent oxidoreductase [Myxococcota bacterium]|nr:FAD-dependent oxidoreductase [Myxococcota bacterium]